MAEYRTNSAPALLVEIRRDGKVALYRQLETAIRDRIRRGVLPAGAVLPSTRALATDLGVSRGVVVEAYHQLIAEGYLASQSGGYTRVALGIGVPTQPAGTDVMPPPPRIDFLYCRPDVSQFPRAAWLRSVRRVLNEAPNDRLGYLDGRGALELREALADYLNRVRGTSTKPECMVICNGFTQGLGLLARALVAGGARTLAVEDPSDDLARDVAARAGLRIVGVPVDEAGIRVEVLEQTGADAVLVTSAAHQLPTGAVLEAEGRAALVDWATRHDTLIIEDDYDAEYRYDRTAIGAIQGLAPDHVVYAGSASKVLAPGLRLGWLAVPGGLVDDLAAAKRAVDLGSPVLEQLTLADFVSRGEFDRHLRRMRSLYRRRRDALLDALRGRLPELEPTGVSAGLHVLAWLPAGVDEAAVVEAAAVRGVGVYGLATYWLNGGGRPGLLFGYGSLSESAIVEGVDLLAEAIDDVRSR